MEAEKQFNVRTGWFPELSCPAEHAAFAAMWARKVLPDARSLAYNITQCTNEARHLSAEAQDQISIVRQAAEELSAQLNELQTNIDQEC